MTFSGHDDSTINIVSDYYYYYYYYYYVSMLHKQHFWRTTAICMHLYLTLNDTQSHRLFKRVILHKLCIIKINLCIIKCQIVYL